MRALLKRSEDKQSRKGLRPRGIRFYQSISLANVNMAISRRCDYQGSAVSTFALWTKKPKRHNDTCEDSATTALPLNGATEYRTSKCSEWLALRAFPESSHGGYVDWPA